MTTRIRRILVATDFSEIADGALDYAIDLARVFNAPITLLHAYELPIVGFPDGAFIVTAEVASGLMNAAQSALAACVARHKAAGVTIDTLLTDDSPSRAVASAAEKVGADLIVLGTHGRRGLAHALLGSVAEKVIRTSTVPVLTWRSPAPVKPG